MTHDTKIELLWWRYTCFLSILGYDFVLHLAQLFSFVKEVSEQLFAWLWKQTYDLLLFNRRLGRIVFFQFTLFRHWNAHHLGDCQILLDDAYDLPVLFEVSDALDGGTHIFFRLIWGTVFAFFVFWKIALSLEIFFDDQIVFSVVKTDFEPW